MTSTKKWLPFAILAFLFCGTTSIEKSNVLFAQWGDVVLKNGGIIYGNAKDLDGDDCQIDLPGGGSVVLNGETIRQKDVPTDALLWYRRTIPLSGDDVESHWAIAKQCSQKGLTEKANRHYQRILELDPENEATHKILQHEKIDGVWTSRREHLEKRGYQRYSGQIMSSQEIELEKMREQTKEATRYWKKQIKTLVEQMRNGNFPSPEDLGAIRSPAALQPISEFFQKESNAEIRLVLVQTIGRIGTPAAMGDLGLVVLNDPDDEVRLTALDAIRRKTTAIPGAIEFFRYRLRTSPGNEQINRAAFALGVLEAKDAVPDLISALITEHKRTVVLGGSEQTGASFDNRGGLRNFSTGGGVKTKVVSDSVNNETVLNALVRIVGVHYHPAVDFRFDVVAWRVWFRDQQQLYKFNARRN